MTLLAAAAGWLLCCAAFAAGLPLLPVAPLAAGVAAALPARALSGRGLHIAAALLVVAATAFSLHRPAAAKDSVAAYAGESVTLVGRATTDADQHPSYSAITLDVQTARSDGAATAASGRVLVFLPAVLDLPGGSVRAGDLLQLHGTLESRADAAGDGGYAAYLERQGVVAALAYPQIALRRRPAADPFHAAVRGLRENTQSGLSAILPPREAALASALVFGNRHALPRDLNADLLTDGATHAVSFSAFNVLLLYGAALGLLAPWLGRRRAALAALSAALLYGVIAGSGASALRGEAIAVALTLATLSGRPHSPAALLALVAAAMTLRDPSLAGDPGFQLTFAAAAGVAVVAPRLHALLSPDLERPARGVGAALAFGLGVSLAVAPVAAVSGGAGLLSPLANILLYPLLAPLTALSALAGALAALWQPLAWPVAASLWLGLRAFTLVVHACAVAPGAGVALRGDGPKFVIAWYAALALAGVLAPRAARWRGRTRSGDSVRGRGWRGWRRSLVSAGAFALLLSLQPVAAALRSPEKQTVTVRWLAAGSRPAALIEGGGVRVLLCGVSEPAALAQAVESATGDGGGVDVLIAAPGVFDSASAAAIALNAGELIVPPSLSLPADTEAGAAASQLLALDGSAMIPLGNAGTLTVLAGARFEAVAIESGGARLLLVEDARDSAGLSQRAGGPFDTVALPPLSGSALPRTLADFHATTLLLAGSWSDADATIARADWQGRFAVATAGARSELQAGAAVLR